MYFKIIHNSTFTCEFLEFLFKYILNNCRYEYELLNFSMEEQDRKLQEVFENEKIHFKKKEQASKEIIADISKRLKVIN